VWNTDVEQNSWLWNYSFDHRGIHFVAADWNPRDDTLVGLDREKAYLHDFDGGSAPFFEAELESLATAESDSVVVVTHIPMHDGAISEDAMPWMESIFTEYADIIWANLAGHTHMNYEVTGEFVDVYVTAATWNSYEPVRFIEVGRDGDALVYTQELFYVPL
jgi:hypothetical protein